MTSLKVNDKAPQFEAKDQDGNTISSKELAGKKYALYFYPKDNTPACINQACNLRDNYSELKKNGIAIIGVSMDDEKSHHKFIAKHDLPFPLIPDTERKLLELFNVWGWKKFMGREYDGIHRTTFAIDEKGIIKGIILKPKTKDHAAEILEIFKNN